METLVLNVGYEPYLRIKWKKAINLLFKGKAEVLEEYPDRYIMFNVKMPCVIRLLRYFNRRSKKLRFSRENVWARDRGQCQYCGHPVPVTSFTFDHVIPKSRGGKTTWENVVVCCYSCNQKKGCLLLSEAKMSLIKPPIKPKMIPLKLRLSLTWNHDMPAAWRSWLYDTSAWQIEVRVA